MKMFVEKIVSTTAMALHFCNSVQVLTEFIFLLFRKNDYYQLVYENNSQIRMIENFSFLLL